jgi:hypothetical protein
LDVARVTPRFPDRGLRVSIGYNSGKLRARFGDVNVAGNDAAQFVSPHGIAVDSRIADCGRSGGLRSGAS